MRSQIFFNDMPKTGKNIDKDLVYPAVPMSAIKNGTLVLLPTEPAVGNSSDYLEGAFVRADGADDCRVKVYDDGDPRGRISASSSSYFLCRAPSPAHKQIAALLEGALDRSRSQTFGVVLPFLKEVTVKFREIAIRNDDWPSVLQAVAKAVTDEAASKESHKAAKAGKVRQTEEKRRHSDVFRRYQACMHVWGGGGYFAVRFSLARSEGLCLTLKMYACHLCCPARSRRGHRPRNPSRPLWTTAVLPSFSARPRQARPRCGVVAARSVCFQRAASSCRVTLFLSPAQRTSTQRLV